MKRIILGLFVMGIATSLSAFTTSYTYAKFTGPYRFKGGLQSWNGSVNKNTSLYTLVTGTPLCVASTNICDYDISNGVVTQLGQGTLLNWLQINRIF